MYKVLSDLEGVYIPEIWIEVAKKTGIEELRRTTKDEPDYNKLMQMRLNILRENNLKLDDITDVIKTIEPYEGAKDMIDWLGQRSHLTILSDTFEQFAWQLMKKLGNPSIFCNYLVIGQDNSIEGYNLRVKGGKGAVASMYKDFDFRIIAFGDSHNDISMIQVAEAGFLFRPPENVTRQYPDIPTINDYNSIKEFLEPYLGR